MPLPNKSALHIASFDGNVGDNASHNGFYNQLKRVTRAPMEMEQREIRRTYLNYQGADRWLWDDLLIEEFNTRPLSVIGGGNYFELWLEESQSGTTIDLAPELIRKVRQPLFFHALGFDPALGTSRRTVERFHRFITEALDNPSCLVTVRNDGSKGYLEQYLGPDISDRISVIPDPGFFVDTGAGSLPVSLREKRFWALNLACDRSERRFPGQEGKLDYDGFVHEITDLISLASSTYPDLEFVLTAHIYSDLDPIRDVLQALPDSIRRWKVNVAPFLHGMGAEQSLFEMYRHAELAMGPRFHANVCPIGLGTPTIGLATTEKLENLYRELGITERVISAQYPGFAKRVMTLAEQTMRSQDTVRKHYGQLLQQLDEQSVGVYGKLKKLVERD